MDAEIAYDERDKAKHDELEIVLPLSYDSTADTLTHAARVADLLAQAIAQLVERSATHDRSKLEPPEKSIFDRYTPILASTVYGSDTYKRSLDEMRTALDHHYATNRHHPEYHRDGVLGMSLVDLIEMLADWMAASERHANGSMVHSLRVNAVRFDIPDGLVRVLWATARALGWLDRPECGTPFTAPDGTRMFCNVPTEADGYHSGPHSDGNFDGGQLLWDDSGEPTGGWTVAGSVPAAGTETIGGGAR